MIRNPVIFLCLRAALGKLTALRLQTIVINQSRVRAVFGIAAPGALNFAAVLHKLLATTHAYIGRFVLQDGYLMIRRNEL